MAGFNIILITFFLFFVGISRGDTVLITALCNKTSKPSICMDCLTKNSSSSAAADFSELAQTLVTCAQSDSGVLRDEIQIQYDSSTDPEAKSILEGCRMRMVNVHEEFFDVIHNVLAEDYDSAKDIITDQIIPAEVNCLDEFNKKPTLPMPSKIISGTLLLTHDCNVAVEFLSITWYNKNGVRMILP